MIVGFTGTSQGMTLLQKVTLESRLAELCPHEFHHGDCFGADAEAHDIVRLKYKLHECKVVIHPPTNRTKRAMKRADEYYIAKSYLVRNRMIVACCDELIAAPRQRAEELRSGTWATIRYARKTGKLIHFLWP